MKYNDIGTNVDTVDKLVLDIYNYAEKINKTLNQIADVVDQTKTFYVCDSANNYRNKFSGFRTNFKIINKNVISYAEDLIKLKNRYQKADNTAAKSVKKSAANIENRNNGWW